MFADEKMKQKTINNASRLRRAFWGIGKVICKLTPNYLFGFRRSIYIMFGAKLDSGVHIYPSTKVWAPWNLTMGRNACLGPNVDCYNVDKIFIGENSTVSQYCYLCTASHDYSSSKMPLITAPIKIKSDAWVTADVFVGPGVTIETGSVILARSSVFSDIPEWSVARGNPAEPFKKRLWND